MTIALNKQQEDLLKIVRENGKGSVDLVEQLLEEIAELRAENADLPRLRQTAARYQRIEGATSKVEAAACAIWAEFCPGMVMGDDDLPHYEAAAKAAIAAFNDE